MVAQPGGSARRRGSGGATCPPISSAPTTSTRPHAWRASGEWCSPAAGATIRGWCLDEPYKAISEGRYDDVPEGFPKITHDMVRPNSVYGATKVWGRGDRPPLRRCLRHLGAVRANRRGTQGQSCPRCPRVRVLPQPPRPSRRSCKGASMPPDDLKIRRVLRYLRQPVGVPRPYPMRGTSWGTCPRTRPRHSDSPATLPGGRGSPSQPSLLARLWPCWTSRPSD